MANLNNTDQYNAKSGTDLGAKLTGYYAELGYNILDKYNTTDELIGFARYENYNTHAAVAEGTTINDAYNRTELTFGLGYKIAKGAMFKADYQIFSDASSEDKRGQFNFGTSIWF